MPDATKVGVLTLIDALRADGGGERLAMELTRELDPSRFDRTLCVTRWDPSQAGSPVVAPALEALRESGVELLGLERRSRLAPSAWARLRRHLRDRGVDVLHAHKFGSNVWGTLIGRTAGVPVVVAHEHSWSYEGSPGRKLLDRHLIGRFADAFVAVSEEDRRRMIEVEGISPSKVRFIPSGMPPVPGGGREEGGGGLRDALDLGSGPVIGAVGTVRPEKALDRLVRAAAILRPRHPGLTVLIAGDGELRPLEALARELGLGSAVRLLGYRSDVSAILETMDVAVNCSIREGTPLSMMEYMDAGLPVVASRVGGVPDLLAGGEAGVLVDTANPEELAGAIAGLLEDPAGAKSMGERGRERRRREFGLETMARRVEDLYEELLQAKRAAGG